MGEAVECDVILAGASCRRHTEFWMVNAAASSDGHGVRVVLVRWWAGKKLLFRGRGGGCAEGESGRNVSNETPKDGRKNEV